MYLSRLLTLLGLLFSFLKSSLTIECTNYSGSGSYKFEETKVNGTGDFNLINYIFMNLFVITILTIKVMRAVRFCRGPGSIQVYLIKFMIQQTRFAA